MNKEELEKLAEQYTKEEDITPWEDGTLGRDEEFVRVSPKYVKLVWTTPDAENMIMKCARVSSSNPDSTDTKLLNYCMKHSHWSIFEMANMCVEINTSRAIARQILRHRSLQFQELSFRYQDIDQVQWESNRYKSEARSQDLKNRQNSIDDMSQEDKDWFNTAQVSNWNYSHNLYKKALKKGIAKEQARVFLPEGQTMSRMYANGNIRSWLTYCIVRCDKATQLEHRLVADDVWRILRKEVPTITKAAEDIHPHLKEIK